MTSPLDPLVQPSALPSPPMSPTSPRTAATRIRIKATPGPEDALGSVSSTPGSERGARSTSLSLSGPVATDSDTPGFETRVVAPASTSAVISARRQSSIAYYTASSPAPWNMNRTLSSSADVSRDVEPVVPDGKENVSKRSSLILSSQSPSTRESISSLDAVSAREREPLTLVERHADLLRFIAQKERKCLELRDQLAAHEKELAELKRKWERIIHRGQDSLPSSPLAAGIGGVALDGLKEGVRIIAAGFSDFGGVILESEPGDDSSKPKSVPIMQPPRDVQDVSNVRAKRTGSEHLSVSSASSVRECGHAVFGGVGGDAVTAVTTIATAPSLARAGSLSRRMHKRASRIIVQEPTTPTSASVSPPAQRPRSADLDVGMDLILAPSPTLVPSLLGTSAPKSPVMGSAHGSAPVSAGPMSSWMDSVGRKLGELQKGQTFSKSQKRASSLLAGVSSTISSALSPGPTATTPAPVPIQTSMSPGSPKSPVATRPPLSPSELQSESKSRPYPSYQSMMDWLDDEEEQTVHAGDMLTPDSTLRLPSTTDVVMERGEAAAAVATTFDDDWNW